MPRPLYFPRITPFRDTRHAALLHATPPIDYFARMIVEPISGYRPVSSKCNTTVLHIEMTYKYYRHVILFAHIHGMPPFSTSILQYYSFARAAFTSGMQPFNASTRATPIMRLSRDERRLRFIAAITA